MFMTSTMLLPATYPVWTLANLLARTSKSSKVIYCGKGSDSLLPTLELKFAAIWALWQDAFAGRSGGLECCFLGNPGGLLEE